MLLSWDGVALVTVCTAATRSLSLVRSVGEGRPRDVSQRLWSRILRSSKQNRTRRTVSKTSMERISLTLEIHMTRPHAWNMGRLPLPSTVQCRIITSAGSSVGSVEVIEELWWRRRCWHRATLLLHNGRGFRGRRRGRV